MYGLFKCEPEYSGVAGYGHRCMQTMLYSYTITWFFVNHQCGDVGTLALSLRQDYIPCLVTFVTGESRILAEAGRW